MNIIKKAAIAAIAISVALPIATAGASKASQYAAWKQRTLPVVSKCYRDYQQLAIDINTNASIAQGNADFNALASDARAFNSHANSPDMTLNFDMSDVAIALSTLVNTGEAVINGNGSVTAFTNAVHTLTAAEGKVTARMKFDNNRW